MFWSNQLNHTITNELNVQEPKMSMKQKENVPRDKIPQEHTVLPLIAYGDRYQI